MSAHVKSEELFFVGKFFVIAPRRDHAPPRCGGMSFVVEQRDLADGAITLCGRSAGKRLVNARKKFRAIAAHKIKCAGLD